LPPDGTVAYGQTSTLRITWVDLFAHEYIPALAGQFGQTGTIGVGFTLDSTQYWQGSELQVADLSLTGTWNCTQLWYQAGTDLEFEQNSGLSLVFNRQALQDWEDPFFGPQAYCIVSAVRGLLEEPTEFKLTISPEMPFAPEYFYLKFMSSSLEWVTNAGDASAPVGVELLWADGSRFVSMLPEKDYILIEPHVEPSYTAFYDALVAGELTLKVRGFERFAGYSLSQRLNADSAIRLRAYY